MLTVSQSLSSIIMLLHAAQRSDGASPAPGPDHLEQARRAARDALAETREFIHALARHHCAPEAPMRH